MLMRNRGYSENSETFLAAWSIPRKEFNHCHRKSC